MKHDFETILDECISRIQSGEATETILTDYPEHAEELEKMLVLVQDLYEIPAPQPSTQAWMEGQRLMLDRFDRKQKESIPHQSSNILDRWILSLTNKVNLLTGIKPKEQIMLRKLLVAAALVLIVILGGAVATTVTAYAAQNSLPGDTLYPVKTTLEDVRLQTSWDLTAEARRSMQYADRRIQEVNELISRNRFGDVSVSVLRFENHLQEALDALSTVAQNDPETARELALVLANLLSEHQDLITALLENNPQADLTALNEALNAARTGIDEAGTVGGFGNDNQNDGNTNGNENDANTNGNMNVNDNLNDNDDDMNDNDDDDMNDNDDDDMNDNDDDDMNDNDDDDMNDNDDDDMNDDDDDDMNDNDDDDMNDNDGDMNDNDDDMNDNDDDDMNDNDDDDMNDNDDDDMNDNDDDNMNDNDDDMNDNDDDNMNDNDDDDDNNDNDDDDNNDNDDDDDDDENDNDD